MSWYFWGKTYSIHCWKFLTVKRHRTKFLRANKPVRNEYIHVCRSYVIYMYILTFR